MSNFPSTSLEAYKALTPEKLRTDYNKIVKALTVLGTGNYEQISDYLQCREPNTISRRLKEMEGLQLIFKTGEKRKTKRNRNAFVYCLTNKMPIIEKQPTISNEQKEETKSINQLELF